MQAISVVKASILSRIKASATGKTVDPCDQPESMVMLNMRIVPKIFEYTPFRQLKYQNRVSN
jgi:hypothetical protein